MPIGHVVIVGLMGVGKTSVGRRLAFRLGWQFVDSDATLAEQTGETARAIAAARSLDELHALEAHALLTAQAARREPLFEGVADVVVDVASRAPSKSAKEIEAAVRERR